MLVSPIWSLQLSHGAKPDVRPSVPSLSLFKSPQLKADVSHSLALPSPSLETALNRWASQQVQKLAQAPPRSPPSVSALVFKYPHIFSLSLSCPCNVVLPLPPVPQAPVGPPLLCFTEPPTCLAEYSGGLPERPSEQITHTNAWDLSIIARGKQVVALCCEQEQGLLELPEQKQGHFFCVVCHLF